MTVCIALHNANEMKRCCMMRRHVLLALYVDICFRDIRGVRVGVAVNGIGGSNINCYGDVHGCVYSSIDVGGLCGVSASALVIVDVHGSDHSHVYIYHTCQMCVKANDVVNTHVGDNGNQPYVEYYILSDKLNPNANVDVHSGTTCYP